jgi:hypothetical protein
MVELATLDLLVMELWVEDAAGSLGGAMRKNASIVKVAETSSRFLLPRADSNS